MTLRCLLAAMACAMAAVVAAPTAMAHQMTLSYVNLTQTDGRITAEIKAPLLDLEVALGIDQDFDGKLTWGEVRRNLDRIAGYVLGRTQISAGGACTLTREAAAPVEQGGEGYVSLRVAVACPDPKAQLHVASSVFLEIDPTSRVLVSERWDGKDASYVLGSSDRAASPAAKSDPAAAGFLSYVVEGVGHLFGGPDHMLFLLVLIIPAIYAGRSLKAVAIAVLLPITGFTLGHALTLTSAASGLIRPPAQIVESLIAVTILLTAIDNVRPFIPGPRSGIAFAFGLIHGFGFASALGALDLSGWPMASALLGFNVGIEAGQAILALAVCPLLFLVRKPAQRFHVMPLGLSLAAGAMALFWIAQRTGLI